MFALLKLEVTLIKSFLCKHLCTFYVSLSHFLRRDVSCSKSQTQESEPTKYLSHLPTGTLEGHRVQSIAPQSLPLVALVPEVSLISGWTLAAAQGGSGYSRLRQYQEEAENQPSLCVSFKSEDFAQKHPPLSLVRITSHVCFRTHHWHNA